MSLVAAESRAGRQERVAWLLVGAGYALVVMAGIGSLMFERLSSPGPGVGVLIVFTFTLAAFALLLLSASGSLIALWALRSGNIRRRPAVFALLALA